MRACVDCLRRTRLLVELSPLLEQRFRGNRPTGVLALDDEALVRTLATGSGAAGRAARQAAALRRSEDEILSRAAADEARSGVTGICRHDAAYPARLLDLVDPPAVLHVLGGTERLHAVLDVDGTRPTVAIVGARRAPDEARVVARRFAESLAAAGVTVVSGLAFGIDAAAHEGALIGRAVGSNPGGSNRDALGGAGTTIAVLAGGPERASPVRHRELHERIGCQGLVVGEMPPGTTPRPWGFPARNRLIAALSDAVLIVAAAARSGSLSTARIALDLHRPVGVVPGPVQTAAFRGSNVLLRDEEGARAVLEPDDVRGLLGERSGHQIVLPMSLVDPLAGLRGPARAIGLRLVDGPRTIEQLIEGQDAAEILAGLGDLEAEGRLQRALDGGLTLLPASFGTGQGRR